jgi:hypothetical protein
MSLIEKPDHKPLTGPERVGWRVDEWSKKTGTSRPTTYRRIADGTLKTREYGGVKLIIGFADEQPK